MVTISRPMIWRRGSSSGHDAGYTYGVKTNRSDTPRSRSILQSGAEREREGREIERERERERERRKERNKNRSKREIKTREREREE